MTKTKQKELLIREINFYLAEEAQTNNCEEATRHYAKARALYTFGVMAEMITKSDYPQFNH